MPTWILNLVAPLLPWVIHNFKRFAGVMLIGTLLIGVPYIAHLKIKAWEKLSYDKGYSQALKDHPTYSGVGTVINNNGVVTTAGLEIFGFGIGGWHRK